MKAGEPASGWTEIAVGPIDAVTMEAVVAALEHRFPGTVTVEERRDGPWFGDDPSDATARYLVRAFVEGKPEPRELEPIDREIASLGGGRLRPSPLESPAPETDWRKQHPPYCVGDRLILSPPWCRETVRGDRHQVLLDPGRAFGLGGHPSTDLALELLEDHLRRGDRVTDLGCGSGVLGLAALALGASNVLALDLDEVAVESCRANAELSDLGGKLEARLGGASAIGGACDLLIANIRGRFLLPLLPEITERTQNTRNLILAGFALEEIDAAIRGLKALGRPVCDRRRRGGYAALLCAGPVPR